MDHFMEFAGLLWILVDFGQFWWMLLGCDGLLIDFCGFWRILMDCDELCCIVID